MNQTDPGRTATLTADEIDDLVTKTVRATLTSIGIEITDPFTMQKDFAHLRAWRESTEEIKRKGFLALVSIVVTGIAGAVWLSIKGGAH